MSPLSPLSLRPCLQALASTDVSLLAVGAQSVTSIDTSYAAYTNIDEGCLTASAQPPAQSLSAWLVAQAKAYGAAVSASQDCQLYFEHTASVLALTPSATVNNLHRYTQTLRLPLAAEMDIIDSEVWEASCGERFVESACGGGGGGVCVRGYCGGCGGPNTQDMASGDSSVTHQPPGRYSVRPAA